MATPRSALPAAPGASFTPSPVTATKRALLLPRRAPRAACRWAWRGQRPRQSADRGRRGPPRLERRSPSPVTTLSRPGRHEADARRRSPSAVVAWSPVIMTTRMPALRQAARQRPPPPPHEADRSSPRGPRKTSSEGSGAAAPSPGGGSVPSASATARTR